MKKKLLLLSLLSTVISFSHAATVTWDGGASTSNWTDAMNWSTNALPTSADVAYISGATVTLSGNTQVQRVYLTGSAMLTVNTGFTLAVSGASGTDAFQVQNTATVVNDGTINISGVTGSGTDALLSKGTFTNNGTIAINGAGQHGLFTQGGSFTNNSGASITVTNVAQDPSHASSGDGIYVDDNSSNPSTLTNNGTITVTMTTGDDGIYVNDGSTLNNVGLITLSGTGSTDNGIRVDDQGIVNNNTGGTLTVNTTQDDQIFLDLTGTINNTGTINLNNAADIGLYVTDNSTFRNLPGGVTNISMSSNYAIQIDANNGLAEIINVGTITTTGGKDGMRIQDGGTFTNNSGGIFNAVSPVEDCINIQSTGGTIVNNGTVDLFNATKEGVDMSAGTLTNGVGAIFKVTECDQDNIEINGTSVINNSGHMILYGVDASGRDDIEVNSGAVFNNTATSIFTPGSSPGEMEVRGLFDLGSGTTTFEINGTSNTTTYDRIEKTSSTSAITITNANALLDWGTFIPAVNDTFTIVDGSGMVNGTFATVNGNNPAIVYIVDYSDPTEVHIVITASPLPVNFLAFSGTQFNDGIVLNWSTENEVNNTGFEIERSFNGDDWSKISFVNSKESSTKIDYSYLDQSPKTGINYYRLKQIDINGDYSYSEVVAVQFENEKIKYTFYPNPVQDVLYIDANIEEKILDVRLFDISGKSLWIGKSIAPISMKEYGEGIYFLQIKSPSNQTIHKIFKK